MNKLFALLDNNAGAFAILVLIVAMLYHMFHSILG